MDSPYSGLTTKDLLAMETQQGNAQQLSTLHVVSEGVELQMLRYVITDITVLMGRALTSS